METPPVPIDRALEEEFAEQERPNPITRQELAEIIRSVLQEPGMMGPSISAASAAEPTANLLNNNLRELLRTELHHILTEGDTPEASTVFRTPRQLSNYVPPIEKEVPKSEYSKTTTFSVDTVRANIITATSADSIKRWTVMKQVLRTEYLWSLVAGIRECPVVTPMNPNGYSPNKIETDIVTGKVMIIKKDDVLLFEYDYVRAYQLVFAMFGESLHHLVSREIKSGDPVGIYRELDKYLFGHQAKDVIKHQNALHDFHPNYNKTFREDLDKMTQLVLSLEGAQERELSNGELNHLISSKFSSDPRPGHESIITATAVSTPDYHLRVRQIVDFIDSIVIPKKPVKFAGMETKTVLPELCREFIKKGTCSRGNNCKYTHTKPAAGVKEPVKPKTPWAKKKGEEAPTIPAYTVVSKNHRTLVGVPRGVISAINPVGYDDRQLLTIKKLQINDAYSKMRQEEKADAWAAEDPSLFEGKQTVDANSITMFRTYPSSQDSRVQDSRVYHQLTVDFDFDKKNGAPDTAGFELGAQTGSPQGLTPIPYALLNEHDGGKTSFIPSTISGKRPKQSVHSLMTLSAVASTIRHRSHILTFWSGNIIARLSNQHPTFMWDTGANRSGTSRKDILNNVTPCEPITIQGAFGPAITPSLKGELGPLKLDTVIINGMGPQTIVSVSQVCQLGHVAIFTSKDFRVYTLPSVLRAMKVLALEGKEVVRGTVHNGLYIQDST